MSTQRINLLPWREDLRQAKNQEFGIVMAIAVGLCAIVLFAIFLFFQDRIDYQEQRNSYLQNEITVLNSKLETIKELENTKKDLLARMKIIQELQGSRSQVVHSFEDVVTAMPDGIWIAKITQRANKVAINGFAESNARVSAYMRNLDESAWFKDPKLVNIEDRGGVDEAAFTLEVTQDSPGSSDDESDLNN